MLFDFRRFYVSSISYKLQDRTFYLRLFYRSSWKTCKRKVYTVYEKILILGQIY